MSRKKVTTINRFDGGMTADLRSGDYTKCAYVSHFDIYRDPNRLIPMPGFVDDMNDGSTSTGMKQYDIRAFRYASNGLYAVGMKSNGTGSKLFYKATPETASWSAVSGGEGTDDIADYTFLNGTSSSNLFFLSVDGSNDLNLSYWDGASVTDSATTIQVLTGDPDDGVVSKTRAFDDNIYFTKGGLTGLGKLSGATGTATQKSTSLFPWDYTSGNEQLGIFGFRTFPSRAQLLLWDSASQLIDQKIEFGAGRGVAVGFTYNNWIGVVNEGLDVSDSTFFEGESNDKAAMSIKAVSGLATETLYRIYGETNTNGAIKPLDGTHDDAMLFYARVPTDATPTTYRQGIWAVGKSGPGAPLAVSVLFDTSSLGLVETYHNFGSHHFFGHAEDGSISRLDTLGGTYDVDATYETLFFGSDTPNMKELNGVGILTEDLPSGGSVTLYYRLDENDSWASFSSSTTTGAEKHQFTRPSGVPIGKFREIQFKVVVSGKVTIKNIVVSITELDDLGFKI